MPYYRKKSDWAAARAAEIRKTSRELQFRPSGGSTLKAARKFAQVRELDREASRWEAMAERFRRDEARAA